MSTPIMAIKTSQSIRYQIEGTGAMTEGEELTQHKSNTVDRALRVHPIVRPDFDLVYGDNTHRAWFRVGENATLDMISRVFRDRKSVV